MWVRLAHDSPQSVLHVAEHMRAWDRAEIFATRKDDSAVALAEAALSCGRIAWVAGKERPIAAFGCAPLWPGVWSMWLFATDEFRQIGIGVTKMVMRSIVPMLKEAGAHRLEARSMEGHTDAQRWLEVIGAKREATLSGYGRDGQDFHIYTWPCGDGGSKV